jgi:hypothetical protein
MKFEPELYFQPQIRKGDLIMCNDINLSAEHQLTVDSTAVVIM